MSERITQKMLPTSFPTALTRAEQRARKKLLREERINSAFPEGIPEVEEVKLPVEDQLEDLLERRKGEQIQISYLDHYVINTDRDISKELIDKAIIPSIIRFVLENIVQLGYRVDPFIWNLVALDMSQSEINNEDYLRQEAADRLQNGLRNCKNLRKLIRNIYYQKRDCTNLLQQVGLPLEIDIATFIRKLRGTPSPIPLTIDLRTRASQGTLATLSSMTTPLPHILEVPMRETHSELNEAYRFLGEVFHEVAATQVAFELRKVMQMECSEDQLPLHTENIELLGRYADIPIPTRSMLNKRLNSGSDELSKWFPHYYDLLDFTAIQLFIDEEDWLSDYEREIFRLMIYSFTTYYLPNLENTMEDAARIANELDTDLNDFIAMHESAHELIAQNLYKFVLQPLRRLCKYIYRIGYMIHSGEIDSEVRWDSSQNTQARIVKLGLERIHRYRSHVTSQDSIYNGFKEAYQLGIIDGITFEQFIAPDIYFIDKEGRLIILDYKTGSIDPKRLRTKAISYAIGVNHFLANQYRGMWSTIGPARKDFAIAPVEGIAETRSESIIQRLRCTRVIFAGLRDGVDDYIIEGRDLIHTQQEGDGSMISLYSRLLEISRFEVGSINSQIRQTEC